MFLRKYVYDELLDIIELRFYLNHDNKSPSLLIFFGVHDGFICVRKRPSITQTIVVGEINRLANIVEDPHWKSYINCKASLSDNELSFSENY